MLPYVAGKTTRLMNSFLPEIFKPRRDAFKEADNCTAPARLGSKPGNRLLARCFAS